MLGLALAVLAMHTPADVSWSALRADRVELIRHGVRALIDMQEPDGAWPYEGVYRVGGEIPLGYRVGGTAIVVETLLFAGVDHDAARQAIERGVSYILAQLDDPLLGPSTADVYDVRVWGHCYALDMLCRLRGAKRMGRHGPEIERWIPRLTQTLVDEEIGGGGWNYANHRQPASFVTAPVVQALLLAQAQGEQVPAAVFQRALRCLRAGRYEDGAFAYSGQAAPRPGETALARSGDAADGAKAASSQEAREAASRPVRVGGAAAASQASDSPSTRAASGPASRPSRGISTPPASVRAALPGSIARSAVCETTLQLLGEGSTEAIAESIEAFHRHWDELERRRKQSGTHAGPYGIAPYYFYYGHRYAAQAIEMLPAARREQERERLLEVVLRTRDADGTWNDRVFDRSRNFGTAMVVLALLAENTPLPPALGSPRSRP